MDKAGEAVIEERRIPAGVPLGNQTSAGADTGTVGASSTLHSRVGLRQTDWRETQRGKQPEQKERGRLPHRSTPARFSFLAA